MCTEDYLLYIRPVCLRDIFYSLIPHTTRNCITKDNNLSEYAPKKANTPSPAASCHNFQGSNYNLIFYLYVLTQFKVLQFLQLNLCEGCNVVWIDCAFFWNGVMLLHKFSLLILQDFEYSCRVSIQFSGRLPTNINTCNY